jgi:uncharacterized protein DUF4124
MNWVFRSILLALIVAALPAVAPADIFRWTDDAGVTHYTNLKSEVPADQAAVQVVVDEAARRPPAANDAPVPDPPAPVAPPPAQPSQAERAEAFYDRSQELSAYLEGLQRGLTVGGGVAVGGGVEINAPLVVGGSSPGPYSYSYGSPYFCAWPYSYACDWPYFYPGVAVFHHERARHLGRLHARPFGFGRVRSFGHSRAFH